MVTTMIYTLLDSLGLREHHEIYLGPIGGLQRSVSAFEVEALRFKIIKNHTFYYNFPSKPFKITFETEKSLSPYV